MKINEIKHEKDRLLRNFKTKIEIKFYPNLFGNMKSFLYI
jgi:hypothetical protein